MIIPDKDDINKDYVELYHNKLVTNSRYIIVDRKYIRDAILVNVVITDTLVCYCFKDIYQKINNKIFLYRNMYINLPRENKQERIKFYILNRVLDCKIQRGIRLYNYEKTKNELIKRSGIPEEVMEYKIKTYM